MPNIDLTAFDPLARGNRPSPSQPVPHTSSVPPSHELDAKQVQSLKQQGFSSGLIRALANSKDGFPLRIWVLDNSASMNARDSHLIRGNFDNLQNVPASRWEELQDCVAYHAQMAALYHLSTRFALLNDPGTNIGPQCFGITENSANTSQEMQIIKSVMTNTRPAGPTPLSHQIANLQKYIASVAPRLRTRNQTATVVLATQGLPTNERGESGPAISQQFVRTLRSLEGLPVWIVVRLCTDDERVFDFYNSIDAQLSLPYDVLDDLFGEALEVYLRNPWINYALPLHRFREMGFRFDVLDAIDERALTVEEVRELCSLLFSTDALPDPAKDWSAFFQVVSNLMAREKQQWNPVTRRVSPWINLVALNRLYGSAAQPLPQSIPSQYGYPSQYQQQSGVQNPRTAMNQQQPHGYSSNQGYQQQTPQQYQQQQQQPPPQQHQQQYQQYGEQQQPPQQYQQQNKQPPQHQQQPPRQPMRQQQPFQTTPQQQAPVAMLDVKKQILTQWALQPPRFQVPRPIDYLLGTVHTTFPPAFGVEPHEYFGKWKPFSLDALSSGQDAVIKRAVRKMKFFLHPDKLPKDFTEKQLLLCKMLWDVTVDAWEAHSKQ